MKQRVLIVLFGVFVSAYASAAGTYIVPGSSVMPESVALPLTDLVSSVDSQGMHSLSFTLPADLVGPGALPITLKQLSPANSDQSVELIGSIVSASCASQAPQVTCTLSYTAPYVEQIVAREPVVTQYLNQAYGNNPQTLSGKLALAAHFRGDPEGVVSFVLPFAP